MKYKTLYINQIETFLKKLEGIQYTHLTYFLSVGLQNQIYATQKSDL